MTAHVVRTAQTSQTRPVSDSDLHSGWLTKAEAALAIGVTTKSVERMAAAGQIQQGATQRQGRGPKIAVYHPDDVARVAAERRTTPAPFVLPAGVTSPVNGNGHRKPEGLQIASPAPDDQVASFFCSLVAAIRSVSETSQTNVALFLTIPEAAAVSGLSQANLRRRCQSGWSGAIKDGAWKIRRADLARL